MAGPVDVIAVDPGLCTGIAWRYIYSTGGEPKEAVLALQMPWFEAMDYLTDVIWGRDGGVPPPNAVVCERFDVTGNTYKKGKKNLYEPLMGRGVLEWACYRAGIPFVLQAPADAMRFCDNEALKNLGWYTRGKEHARDATRHLVKYLADNGQLDLRRMMG